MLAITARGITDEQARQRTTASDFTLVSLIAHVASVIRGNVTMLEERDENSTVSGSGEPGVPDSIEQVLAELDSAGRAMEQCIAALGSLDDLIPQPIAPWAPERIWWTARRVLLHLLREIAHHSGHADIIREALDGQSTMRVVASDMGLQF